MESADPGWTLLLIPLILLWTRTLVRACLLTVTLEAPEGKQKHIRLLRPGLRTGTLPLPPTYAIGQSKSYGQATPRAGKYTPPMSRVWMQGGVKNWDQTQSALPLQRPAPHAVQTLMKGTRKRWLVVVIVAISHRSFPWPIII